MHEININSWECLGRSTDAPTNNEQSNEKTEVVNLKGLLSFIVENII